MTANLLTSARLDSVRPGRSVEAWSPWTPMPSLAPAFSVEAGPANADAPSLRVAGDGNRYCFGAWTQRVSVKSGTAYRLRVVLRAQGIDGLFLHVTPHIVWRRDGRPDEE